MYLHLIREAESKGKGGRSGCKPFCTADSACRYAYDFDDIGNRITSTDLGTNRTYTANALNQYTQISNLCDSASLREEFHPQFDDAGNQTLIQTSTGIWQVQYNGENRPIHWERIAYNSSTPNPSNPPLITMSFDRMGRRATKNAQRFIYDGYLQIANFELASTNSQLTTHNPQLFVWDPTEPVATRPLVWNRREDTAALNSEPSTLNFYTHDGNKNVSETVSENANVLAHYEYAPSGAVSVLGGTSVALNPWCFSSEFADHEIPANYYIYRHYETGTGRWLSRDPADEDTVMLYVYAENDSISLFDHVGLEAELCNNRQYVSEFKNRGVRQVRSPIDTDFGKAAGRLSVSDLSLRACCKCVPNAKGQPTYELKVEVKSSYKIEIVSVGTKWYGGKARTKKGYERTLSHGGLHGQTWLPQ